VIHLRADILQTPARCKTAIACHQYLRRVMTANMLPGEVLEHVLAHVPFRERCVDAYT
jgi:hypothetical protein